MIRHFWTDDFYLSLFPSIASVVEMLSHQIREHQDVPSIGPGVGSVMPFNGQSHAKRPVINGAPVPDDIALVTVSSPSKLRRPSWPPQVVHADGGTHSRQLVRPYTVPSFAGDTPGPSSSTAAQQNTIGNTHSKCLGSYDPSVNQVNESRETYPLPPDFATSLSSDGRRRMEGVSLPASIVPLHY
jgi:hypothetical protein